MLPRDMNIDWLTHTKTVRHIVLITLCGTLFFGPTAAMAGGVVATAEGRVGSDDSGNASGFLVAVSALALTIAPFAWSTKKRRQTKQEEAFHQRFTGDPRGVSKDFLRRRGMHYDWAKKLLGVSSSVSIAFDCSLAGRRNELKARVKTAKSMNSEDTARVAQLLREAHTAAKKRPAAFDTCQLKARYFDAPKIFRAAVLGQYEKGAGRTQKHLDTL